MTCRSIWVLLPLVISRSLFGVSKSGRRGTCPSQDLLRHCHHDNSLGWWWWGVEGGACGAETGVAGVCASPVRSVAGWELREHVYAAPPQFPMYSAVLLFEIRNLFNAGNQLNVAMVHHSGSIQSFKQQKGWSLMGLFRFQWCLMFECDVWWLFLCSQIVCDVKWHSELSGSWLADAELEVLEPVSEPCALWDFMRYFVIPSLSFQSHCGLAVG